MAARQPPAAEHESTSGPTVQVSSTQSSATKDVQGFVFNKPSLPDLLTPPADAFRQMLEAGQGIVFLHHAMSAWPTWPLWAEVVGGRWNYVAGELRGVTWPPSGYAREVEHHISCIDPSHPVCAGVEEGFDIVDEIYLNPVLEDEIVPLLRTDFDMTAESFYSGQHAIQGGCYDREGPGAPTGKRARRLGEDSRSQPDRLPPVGTRPGRLREGMGFRRLLANSIAWVASGEAHEWAADNETALPR